MKTIQYRPFLQAAFLFGGFIMSGSLRADFGDLAAVHSRTADGAWRYSDTSPLFSQPAGQSTTYFPTSLAEFTAANSFAFRHYVLPDAQVSTVTGGDTWQGTGDAATFQVFDTYVISDRDQVINLGIGGDDGHSLFVDGAFVEGAGFGGLVDYALDLQAGFKRKITIAGYNGPPDWSFSIGSPIVPTPATNPIFANSLQGVPGIRLNADGNFPLLNGTPKLGNLGTDFGDAQVAGNGIAWSSSFTTDSVGYQLQNIVLAAHVFNNTDMQPDFAELRIRADNAGVPGALVASLGIQSGIPDVLGTATFESTGVALQPNTRYWITVGERGAGDFQVNFAFSNQPDFSSTWTLGSGIGLSLNYGDTWQVEPRFGQPHESLMFRITAKPGLPALAGDYNQNGIVDAADYVVWRDKLGSGAALANDNTMGVGQDDYVRWKTNFGNHSGSGSGVAANAAIPEPAIAMILCGAMLATFIRQRMAAS